MTTPQASIGNVKSQTESTVPVQNTAGRFSRVSSFLSITFFVLAVAASIPTVILPALTQGDRWNVLSGSMEPSIMIGDMIVSHKVDPVDVKVGDVLVYSHPAVPEPVTHRVVDISDSDFILRGDANPADDAPVAADQIIGKMSYQIPKIGHVAGLIEDNRPLLTLAFVGMIGWFIVDERRKKKSDRKRSQG